MADTGRERTKTHPLLRKNDRAAKRMILWLMLIGILLSGVAFAYKIAEFIFAMSEESVRGAFDVPVIVYFCVAGGWLCLLFWCFSTGKFKDMEADKSDLLAQEEEYERLGI